MSEMDNIEQVIARLRALTEHGDVLISPLRDDIRALITAHEKQARELEELRVRASWANYD
jgi:hypothetical protein